MQYQSIDHAAQQLQQLGQGCFLAKTDIADAFCIVPMHPSQYCWFGFVWREQFYYDRCLPMDCSVRCKIFETLSNALQWIASSKLHIRNILHVLDDFLLHARDKAVGQAQLSTFLSMCADIGIPIAPDKTVQPTQVITFLGLELDSVAMEVFPDIQRHKGHTLDEKTSTLLSASQHPLPSSSHPWHKQQLGRLSISSAGGNVPGVGAKGLSLSCQHPLSPSIAALTRHAEQLLASALAPGTQAAYKRSWSMFGKFCNTHGLPDTVPISESVLALFISHLHRAGYSPATVSPHIPAIGYIYKLQGGSDPTTTFSRNYCLHATNSVNNLTSECSLTSPCLASCWGP